MSLQGHWLDIVEGGGVKVIFRKLRSGIYLGRRFIVSQRFGFSPARIYQENFFDGEGFAQTIKTAELITNYLINTYHLKSVLDIGCGPCAYVNAFSNKNVFAVGCDGSPYGVKRATSPSLAFVHDAKIPLIFNRKFDLVMSVEVAEHIPTSSSETLVTSLCQNSDGLVVFTAAPPGTPGDDHINCKPREFWEKLFNSHGYILSELETTNLRAWAKENNVAEWWYKWSFIFRAGK